MKNTQSLPAVAEIPTPPDVIVWQLNNAAKLGAAAAGFGRQIAQYEARIAELRQQAEQVKAEAEKRLTELMAGVADLETSRDQTAGKRAKELGERDVALRMVALWWQETHGPDAPLPPIPDEAPADATGPFPAVLPDGATQVIPAVRLYAEFDGHRVVVELGDGTHEGVLDLDANGGSKFCLGEMDGESSFMIRELAEIRSIRLADPATPAAQEAGQADG